MRGVRPRRVAPLLPLLAGALSGRGFLTAAADPDARPVEHVPIDGTPPPLAPVPLPPDPVPVAGAALADRSEGTAHSGRVEVVRTPVGVGVPPLPGSLAADCGLPDDGSACFLGVEATFGDTSTAGMAGLAADVTLTAADGSAPRAGTAAFGFAVGSGVGSVTTLDVWVVARNGVPTADMVVRVSGLRNEAGSNATGPWDEVTVTGGGCADDPSALCVPLG